jgi:Domain of unknown function DUF29
VVIRCSLEVFRAFPSTTIFTDLTTHSMDEILELRQCIQEQRYDAALLLITEMEEMAKDDKLNKIYSYCVILLVHLIKQGAEQRTTHSWDVSVRNALHHIHRVNKHRKSGGYYADAEEIYETLEDAYPEALSASAAEAFGGVYDEATLAVMVGKGVLLEKALAMITVDDNI